MSELQTKLPTDTWVVTTWDEYMQAIENPAYEKAKVYYHNIIAFAILTNGGNKRITQSQVLPELTISLLEEALRRSRQVDQAQVGAWSLAQMRSPDIQEPI